MSGANGSHRRYSVEMIGRARDEFLDIVRRADELDRGTTIIAAYRSLLTRLGRDPRQFGEPMYHLDAMRMEVRKAAIDPLYIEYGVHDKWPVVIIRRVQWLSDPGSGIL